MLEKILQKWDCLDCKKKHTRFTQSHFKTVFKEELPDGRRVWDRGYTCSPKNGDILIPSYDTTENNYFGYE